MTETITTPNGTVLEQFTTPSGLNLWVHTKDRCVGEHCPVHNPSPHAEGIGYLWWRYDRAIFERICAHGVGHPDPDQYAYWDRFGNDDTKWQSVHGCDGCCRRSKDSW